LKATARRVAVREKSGSLRKAVVVKQNNITIEGRLIIAVAGLLITGMIFGVQNGAGSSAINI
jgi:hypothetical protein